MAVADAYRIGTFKGPPNMAKKKNSTNDSVTAATEELPTVVQYGDWKATITDLSPKAISYLLQNGFSQSMTDAAAFSKKDKEKAVEGKDESEHEEIIAAMAHEARQKRFEAILAGTVGARVGGGPKMTTLDKMVRNVAMERLKAAAVKKNVKLPKGEQLTTLADKFIAGPKGDEIRKEAQARIDAATAQADDVGDLLDAAA